MNYEGKLYGKVGKKYIELAVGTEYVDRLNDKIAELKKIVDKPVGNIDRLTREELIEKAEIYIYQAPRSSSWTWPELMADFHIEMMKLEDHIVCPKCGSDNDKVVITLYCNNCGVAY